MPYPHDKTPAQRAIWHLHTWTIPGIEAFIGTLNERAAESDDPQVAANLRNIAYGARHTLESVRREIDGDDVLAEVFSASEE